MGRTAKAIVAERRAQEAAALAPWFDVVLAKPPSVNTLTRNPTAKDGRKFGRIPTKRYLDWQKSANAPLRTLPKISGLYEVRFEFGRRKGSDLFNFEKALSDQLKKAGVVDDDSLCEHGEVDWAEDLRANQCRVFIRPFARVATNARARIAPKTPVLGGEVEPSFHDKLSGTSYQPETAPALKPAKRTRKRVVKTRRGFYIEETEVGEQLSIVPPARSRAKGRGR